MNDRLKEATAAVSFANLAFLQIWTELLTYTRANTYLMKLPPAPAEYYAALAAMVLLALAVWPVIGYAWHGKGVAAIAAQWTLLLALVLPLNALRGVISRYNSQLRGGLFDSLSERGVLALGLVLGTVALMAALRYRWLLVRGILNVLLPLSVFAAVTATQAVYTATRFDDTPFRDKPLAIPTSGAHAQGRVLWLIFDELDQRLAFEKRPSGIQLPAFDFLRETSLYATEAYPPASATLESLPALINGRIVRHSENEGPDMLSVTFAGEKQGVDWKAQPNVFSQARLRGYNTALIGWYHPYCRVLNGDLTQCWWSAMPLPWNSKGSGFTQATANHLRSLVETSLLSPFGPSLSTVAAAARYQEMMREATRAVTDRSLGLTLIHIPVPHPPHTYNRKTGQFTLSNAPVRGYADSLVLADITLRRIRDRMEQAGLWDTTTVLVSSDHWYRSSRALDGKEDRRVPFLLKLAGQKAGLEYTQRFNTVASQNLLLAILANDLQGPKDAAQWLSSHPQPVRSGNSSN